MKKFILFLLLLLPFNVFALSFSPKECLTIEVGDSPTKVYDYFYYTYVKPLNQENPYFYCQNTNCYVFLDFYNSNYKGHAIDYLFTNGTTLVFQPVGYDSNLSSNRSIVSNSRNFSLDSTTNVYVESNFCDSCSNNGFSVGSGSKTYSFNTNIFTSEDKITSYDITSVSKHYIRTPSDIENEYNSISCPSDSGGGAIEIDYSIFYTLCIILFIFFWVWFLRVVYPMKGGRDL